MNKSNRSAFQNAAFSGLISFALVWQAAADCRFSASSQGKPEGFTQSTSAKLNPLRHEASMRSLVQKVSGSEVVESGIIESRSFSHGTWGCNFSSFQWSDGVQRILTAKHCVSNEFEWVNSDAWSSTSFATASVRVKIAKRMVKTLEASDSPENGSTVNLLGCVPSGDGCFRVEGALEDLFEKEGETVRGVWLAPSEYSKMVGNKVETALDGYSGTPALDSNGKVFWVVSATLQADFKENPEGKCLPTAFGIAIAPVSLK